MVYKGGLCTLCFTNEPTEAPQRLNNLAKEIRPEGGGTAGSMRKRIPRTGNGHAWTKEEVSGVMRVIDLG